MPNIRSQTLYNDGGVMALEIVATDGRKYTLTKADVRAFYSATTGNAASRRNQVIDTIKNGILAALGPEQIALADLSYDFSAVNGRITSARIGGA